MVAIVVGTHTPPLSDSAAPASSAAKEVKTSKSEFARIVMAWRFEISKSTIELSGVNTASAKHFSQDAQIVWHIGSLAWNGFHYQWKHNLSIAEQADGDGETNN